MNEGWDTAVSVRACLSSWRTSMAKTEKPQYVDVSEQLKQVITDNWRLLDELAKR